MPVIARTGMSCKPAHHGAFLLLPVTVLSFLSALHASSVMEYYVTAQDGAACPNNSVCHNLSYYTSEPGLYFTPNTIFYFLEGVHVLYPGAGRIADVDNLTLLGLGKIEQGFHVSVLQSTSVLRCVDEEGSLEFVNGESLFINGITIAGCGRAFLMNFTQYESFVVYVSLLILNVTTVSLDRVSVQNGTGFGLITANCPDVSITNSSFSQNNFNSSACFDLYNCIGGNAVIAYEGLQGNVTVTASNFSFGFSYDYSYLEAGGGLVIYFDSSSHYGLDITLTSLNLFGNSGQRGANLFISLQSPPLFFNFHVVDVKSTNGNTAISVSSFPLFSLAPGLYVIGEVTNVMDVQIMDSTFSDNIALSGNPGVAFDLFTESACDSCGKIILDSCVISDNVGGGDNFAVYFYVYFSQVNALPPASITIRNTIIQRNTGSQVYFGETPSAVQFIEFYHITVDNVTIADNYGSGILCIDCSLELKGNVVIDSNTAVNGGGLALYGESFILLDESSKVSLINNKALFLGGAVYVDSVPVSGQISYPCFFQVNNSVDGFFTPVYCANNTASVTGSVLYGGDINTCSGSIFFDDFFNYTAEGNADFYAVSSDPYDVCLCSNSLPDCDTFATQVSLYPGEELNISVVPVGQNGGVSLGQIITRLRPVEYLVPGTAFTTTAVPAKCTNITLAVFVEEFPNGNIQVCFNVDTVEYCLTQVIVTLLDCPPGFSLDSSTGVCSCNPILVDNVDNITCNIAGGELQTSGGGVWLDFSNDSDCFYIFPNCPFDYCTTDNISFSLNASDTQCAWSRAGLLCGQCQENCSLLLGSNKCAECTSNNLALLIPFSIAGILLVILIIVLNLTVSIGTINGLIFYANIIRLYSSLFFPQCPIPFLSQFISWLNLDFGIETCFYQGMEACGKTWLQFLFPAYIWLLLILIIVVSRYSSLVQRMVGTHAVPVLATLLLLSYTKIIRTVILALYLVNLECIADISSNSTSSIVWFVDANISYLSGCHIPLFIFSLLVLVFLVIPFTILLIFFPVFEGPLHSRFRSCRMFAFKMKPFFDSFGGPYKDNFRFWTGFLLFIRVVLALCISFNPNNQLNLDLLMYALAGALTLNWLAGDVYKNRFLSVLEETFMLNLLLLAYWSAAENDITNLCVTSSPHQASSGAIIALAFAFMTFVGILIFHIHVRFAKSIHALCKKSKLPSMHLPLMQNSTILERMLPTTGHETSTVTLTDCSISDPVKLLRRETLLLDDEGSSS